MHEPHCKGPAVRGTRIRPRRLSFVDEQPVVPRADAVVEMVDVAMEASIVTAVDQDRLHGEVDVEAAIDAARLGLDERGQQRMETAGKRQRRG